MSETNFDYFLSIWNLDLCTKNREGVGMKVWGRWSCRQSKCEAAIDSSANHSGSSGQAYKESPAESSSQLFFKPLVPRLLRPWICQNTAYSQKRPGTVREGWHGAFPLLLPSPGTHRLCHRSICSLSPASLPLPLPFSVTVIFSIVRRLDWVPVTPLLLTLYCDLSTVLLFSSFSPLQWGS